MEDVFIDGTMEGLETDETKCDQLIFLTRNKGNVFNKWIHRLKDHVNVYLLFSTNVISGYIFNPNNSVKIQGFQKSENHNYGHNL